MYISERFLDFLNSDDLKFIDNNKTYKKIPHHLYDDVISICVTTQKEEGEENYFDLICFDKSTKNICYFNTKCEFKSEDIIITNEDIQNENKEYEEINYIVLNKILDYYIDKQDLHYFQNAKTAILMDYPNIGMYCFPGLDSFLLIEHNKNKEISIEKILEKNIDEYSLIKTLFFNKINFKINNTKCFDFLKEIIDNLNSYKHFDVHYNAPNGDEKFLRYHTDTIDPFRLREELIFDNKIFTAPLNSIKYMLVDSSKKIINNTEEVDEKTKSINWIKAGNDDGINNKYFKDKDFILKVIRDNPNFFEKVDTLIRKDKNFILNEIIKRNETAVLFADTECYKDINFCNKIISKINDNYIFAFICENCKKENLEEILKNILDKENLDFEDFICRLEGSILNTIEFDNALTKKYDLEFNYLLSKDITNPHVLSKIYSEETIQSNFHKFDNKIRYNGEFILELLKFKNKTSLERFSKKNFELFNYFRKHKNYLVLNKLYQIIPEDEIERFNSIFHVTDYDFPYLSELASLNVNFITLFENDKEKLYDFLIGNIASFNTIELNDNKISIETDFHFIEFESKYNLLRIEDKEYGMSKYINITDLYSKIADDLFEEIKERSKFEIESKNFKSAIKEFNTKKHMLEQNDISK